MSASSIRPWPPAEAIARIEGPCSASQASRSGSSHNRCSGSRSSIRSATTPIPAAGMRTSRGFIRSALSAFPAAPDVAHATAMASPDGTSPARRRPLVRRLMLRDFRSYASLDLRIGGRLVVLCGENGAGKTNLLEALSLLAPGRGLRRAELAECARRGGGGGFALSIEVEEDGVVRQLGSGWSPADANGGAERKNRIDRAPVSSSRAFSDHVRVVWLTPAMDSLFAGPAGERRRFLDRFVLAIDPGHGARVGAFERALRQRNRLLDEDRPQRRLARRDRARGRRTRRRDRSGAARMREPPRGADRRRARRRLALSLGAAGARRRDRGARRRAVRRSPPRTATARCCATIAVATPPPAAP